jgi:Uma2 family endonuclease
MSRIAFPEPKPSDDDLYEIIDGERVYLTHTPLGACLVSQLACPLGNFVNAENLGWTINHALFHLPAPINRERRPDIAFVSYKRWAKDRRLPYTDPWDVVPNLATEVVSPTDSVDELEQKIAEYFHAGVQLVWVVHPTRSKIHVYESPSQITVLTRDDVLDGGSVVPGFKLPLAELFTDAAAVPNAGNGDY